MIEKSELTILNPPTNSPDNYSETQGEDVFKVWWFPWVFSLEQLNLYLQHFDCRWSIHSDVRSRQLRYYCKQTYLSFCFVSNLFQAFFGQDLLPFLASINWGLRMLTFLFTFLELLRNIVFLGRKDHTWSFLFMEGGLSGLAQDCSMFSRDRHRLRAKVAAWLRLLQMPEIRGKNTLGQQKLLWTFSLGAALGQKLILSVSE